MSDPIEFGRLLRASTTGCVVGCKVNQLNAPSFGGMVRIPLEDGTQVYGLIYDIHMDDDSLVRQLVTAEGVSEAVIMDNRVNRNVPVEISVLFVGHQKGAQMLHLLPPRPPLTLDLIYICTDAEICAFTSAGRFGYFRHVLRSQDVPVGELLAAHVRQAAQAHQVCGQTDWANAATQELITLLRADFSTLMSVLGALADASL